MINVNLVTNIAYGYVSAHEMCPDVVNDLLYGPQAETNADEDGDDYEPSASGTSEGVHYATSYLGGALNFFILHSPHIVKGFKSSPCVPNAGILHKDSEGSVECYGIPAGWWDTPDA